MPVSADAVGRELPPVEATVERGRVRLFAQVIGETDPAFLDVDAARAAGHPDLPVPPTFLFGLELDQPDPYAYLTDLGIDLRHVLHGEQTFTYYQPVHAGETLTAQPRIADVYSKRGGAMQFVVKQTSVSRPDGTVVAELTSTIIVRDPEAAR
jgi:acyl dehydratase